MNTPINYELAKLLLEKGFDNIDCNGYYHVNNGYSKGYSFCYSSVSTQEKNGILAPTIAEAIMWLYNNHQIWIGIIKTEYNHRKIFKPMIDENAMLGELKGYLAFDSPEEAYEAAIKYVLENLI